MWVQCQEAASKEPGYQCGATQERGEEYTHKMKWKLFSDIVRQSINSMMAPIVVTKPVSTVNLITWFKDALDRLNDVRALARASYGGSYINQMYV